MKKYLLCSSWIKTVNPKGNQPWIFTERTNAEAPIIWTPVAKSWLLGKDPDAGKDWRQEEKGTTEGEMVGWYHRPNGFGFEQAPGAGDGQGGLGYTGLQSQTGLSDWTRRIDKATLWSHYCTEYRNFLVSFCLRLSLKPLLTTSCSYSLLFKCIWISAVKTIIV